MAEEENIKVVVRIRDLIAREKDQERVSVSMVEILTHVVLSQVFSVVDAKEIVRKGTDKSWTFDRVYNPVEDNRLVFLFFLFSFIEIISQCRLC